MKIVKFGVMLLLTSFYLTQTSLAQPANSAMPIVDPNCVDSLEVCQQRAQKKEKLRQRCLADPVWCEKRRANIKRDRDERRALRRQCKANPEQCPALKKEFAKKKAEVTKATQQKRRKKRKELQQAQKQWCIDNPSDCKRWKADWKALQKQLKKMQTRLQEQYPTRPR